MAATHKTYTLTFPDGLVIPGFVWSLAGWYLRTFPDSGINSHQYNTLNFTRWALEDAGIEMIEAPAIAGEPQFAAIQLNIMQGPRHIATAASHNMAKRIARALNLHPINERGY